MSVVVVVIVTSRVELVVGANCVFAVASAYCAVASTVPAASILRIYIIVPPIESAATIALSGITVIPNGVTSAKVSLSIILRSLRGVGMPQRT